MKNDLVKTSKFLSYVLRHRPDSISLTLDSQGWASVQELLAKADAAGTHITPEQLELVVADNDKKRFVLSEDKQRIRAAQGHSVEVDLKLKVKTPPPVLYHGTVDKFLDSIRKKGLVPGTRHDVHLSADKETATIVAARRGKPVILVIPTQPLLKDGYQFRQSDNGVWLLPAVPAKYIQFPG